MKDEVVRMISAIGLNHKRKAQVKMLRYVAFDSI